MKLREGVLLLQDGAPIHTAQVIEGVVFKNGFKLLLHLLYSLDLSLSDFFLLSKFETHLHDQHFSNNDEFKYCGGVFRRLGYRHLL